MGNKIQNIETCCVCGKPAFADGCKFIKCPYCNFEIEQSWDKAHPEKITYPLLVSVSRAREQYRAGKPFQASFEEFLEGLDFYAEMSFRHGGLLYYVMFSEGKICVGHDDVYQLYDTVEEFAQKANIDGRLLRDIWDEVENPSYMFD